MTLRTFAAITILCLLSGPLSTALSQPADSLLQGTFWKAQGLEMVLPAWTEHARTHEGVFFAELDRRWTPRDSTTQYPGMVARHLFSYSAAYLMSGEPSHLRHAEEVLNFMIEHGWDRTHGGWYNAVRRSGEVVDEQKDLFMQIYATTGLALYWIVTRDETAASYLRKSRQFINEYAWDDEHGGYVSSLNRDGSVASDVKRFTPQLAPVSGYLLYLYSATRDSTDLRRIERIMDLTLTHMQDERGWILEQFATDWSFLPEASQNEHLSVGHNLEVAWLLLRLHAITGNTSYREKGIALTDKLLSEAFHPDTGAWSAKLDRTNPSDHSPTTTWWTQAYGNFLQLYAYRTTGSQRYLDAFRAGAEFWNRHVIDSTYGGTVLRSHLAGGVADGTKAVRSKTSYHAMEHSLLLYLYVDLWVNRSSVSLHYRIENPDGRLFHPLPVEEFAARIERVSVNGTLSPGHCTSDGTVRLPEEGPVELRIDVSSSD